MNTVTARQADLDEATQRRLQRHRAQLAQRQRATRLNDPLREPELSPELARDTATISRLEAEAEKHREAADKAFKAKDHKTHKAELGKWRTVSNQILVLRRRVHNAREAQIDTRWAGHALAESEALAKVRGDDTEVEDTEVAEWLRNEDGSLAHNEDDMPILKVEKARAQRVLLGLELAFRRGDLGDGKHEPLRLREIGRQYQAAYDAAVSRLTPEAQEIRASGVPEPQMRALMAFDDLKMMRGEIEAPGVIKLTGKQLAVLDHVCGRDMTIGATATAIRAGVPSVRRALRGGLERAGDNASAVRKERREKADEAENAR